MNDVIGHYFEESHRWLQEGTPQPRGAPVGLVQLPPIDTAPAEVVTGRGEDVDSAALAAQAARSLSAARRETAQLEARFRDLQDRLAIVSAKKQAYRTSARQLEQKAGDLELQSEDMAQKVDALQAELRAAAETRAHAEGQILAMRTAHLHEVRLLQKGLAARKDAKVKDRIDEVADLLAKLGGAVLQRDASAVQRARLEQKAQQLRQENRALKGEHEQMRAELDSLLGKLRATNEQNAALAPDPRPPGMEQGDEAFELALQALEKRYAVLNSSTTGLQDAVAELGRRTADLQDIVNGAEVRCAEAEAERDKWRAEAEHQDAGINALTAELSRLQASVMSVQDAVDKKEREIKAEVKREKVALERDKEQLLASQRSPSPSPLPAVPEGAPVARPEGVEKPPAVSGLGDFDVPEGARLTPATPSDTASPGLGATHPPPGMPRVEPTTPDASPPEDRIRADGSEVLASLAHFAKTGELLQLEVVKLPGQEPQEIELRAHEISTGETFMVQLDQELLEELDNDDPWGEVFSVVGIDLGPPKALVLPTLLGRDRMLMEPAGIQLIVSVYKYSATRFFLNGFDEGEARLVDLVLLEDSLTEEHAQFIEACGENQDELFHFFCSRLQVVDQEGLQFVFT